MKCVGVRPNRLRYLLTPTGIAEKTRLTYEFMQYSLVLYGQVRQHLRVVLEPCALDQRTRIALYGTGEAAELAYLSIAELGLELVAVFDGGAATGRFLGHPIRDIQDHNTIAFDLLVVASLEPGPHVVHLAQLGVSRDRLVTLRR